MIYDWHLDPVLWTTGTITVRWYGLFFAVGFLLAYKVFEWIYVRDGGTLAGAHRILVWMVVGTVVGGRLGHCLFYETTYYLENPVRMLAIWKGGNASHGATFGLVLLMLIYAKVYQVPVLWLFDRLSIPIALPAAFVRLGNFSNSEILGWPTHGNWGVVFSRVDQLPRHPYVLYEAAANLVVFSLMLWLYLRTRASQSPGRLWGTFFILLFSVRCLTELSKQTTPVITQPVPLTQGQLLSLPCILLGVVVVCRSVVRRTDPKLNNNKDGEATSSADHPGV